MYVQHPQYRRCARSFDRGVIAASPAVAATGKEVALLGKLTSYCQPPSSTSPPMGVAHLSTRVVVPASPEVAGATRITVNLKSLKLFPARYDVWLADVNLGDDGSFSCAALHVGTTNGTGKPSGYADWTYGLDDAVRSFEVVVSGDLFGTFTGYPTPLISLDLGA